MLEAMALAQSGSVSTNCAADRCGVPRSTLKDRLCGRVVHGVKPGPRPYLDAAEETELVDYLFDSAKAGYGKTRQQVKSIAEKIAKSKGVLKSDRISDGWWRRFLERKPQVALRRGDPTAHVRMDAINREGIQQYYELLKDVLDEHDLIDHPERIYNMDETGMPFDPRPPKVAAPRGLKKVRYRSTGKKGQITIVGCVSATGQAMPPFVIFDAKQLNPHWTRGEVPGTRYGLSHTGWIDQELFHGWLVEHFLTHAVGVRPLLLLLDGHSSHYEPESIRIAKENGIIVFCLPPHTTHETQPLDCSLFGPLKSAWTKVCHDFLQKNPGKTITKFNFSELFHKAWMTAVTPETICSGFQKAGVYPFNPDAIKIPTDSQHQSECTDQSSVTALSNPAQAVLSSPPLVFTADQEALNQRRYEENYDLYDPEYFSWLEMHHPDAMPLEQHLRIEASTSEPDVDLLSEFSYVPPAEPLIINETESTPSPSISTPMPTFSIPPSRASSSVSTSYHLQLSLPLPSPSISTTLPSSSVFSPQLSPSVSIPQNIPTPLLTSSVSTISSSPNVFIPLPCPSFSTPLLSPSVSILSPSPIVSSPLPSPSISSSLLSPRISIPLPSPSISATSLPSPNFSIPLPSTSDSTPLLSASVSIPLPSLNVSTPLLPSSATIFLLSPSISTPLLTSSVSTCPPSPSVYTPLPSPKISTPLPSPRVSTPLPSPSVSTPLPSPSVSTPLPSPSVSTPLLTSSVSTLPPSPNDFTPLPSLSTSIHEPSLSVPSLITSFSDPSSMSSSLMMTMSPVMTSSIPLPVTTPVVKHLNVSSLVTSSNITPVASSTNSNVSSAYSLLMQQSRSSKIISQFLTPVRPCVTRKTGSARVLTSDECIAMLEEKKLRRQREAMEKERRKQERTDKKRQREEEAKRKVAERQQKKQQREEQLHKKAEEKAQRAAEKARKLSNKTTAKQNKKGERSSKSVENSSEPKKSRVDNDEIDDDHCCVCFGTFSDDTGTGREWIQCGCSRWLHEDCIDEVLTDASGQERICPLCVM